MNAGIWEFHGGIHPPQNKTQSTAGPIQRPPLPSRLVIPLTQHIGAPAVPCVETGQHVLKGQPIALPDSRISAALHAPTSGRVTLIGDQPYPHVSGMWAPAIVIESDGRDEWIAADPCADYTRQPPHVLLERIRQAGISGLGGAGFPTMAKLSIDPSDTIHTLIVNAAECEPYITADDMLMREQPDRLIGGIDVLAYILKPQEVIIGIEDNKPQAIAELRHALGNRPYRIQVIPTKYPSGGEKQLIRILTGREVPHQGLPADIGIICQNVGTLAAIHDAVVHCRPLISRIVTLTGNAVRQPMNVEALIGTSLRELLAFAGLQEDKMQRLIMGGPLMGSTLASLDVPLIKTTNCLLAVSAGELPHSGPTLPCIRCGNCAQVCPIQLLPQQLHFFALGEQYEQLQTLNLFDCIECGCCAYVCPSNIPLVQYYRAAKADIREQRQKHLKSEQAKQRFEQRQQRLAAEDARKAEERLARQEKSARVRAAREAGDAAPAESAQTEAERVSTQKSSGEDQYKRLKIEASMAKAALKKAEREQQENDSDAVRERIDKLRSAAEKAEQALQACETATDQPAAKAENDDTELKRAKIAVAMTRTQLKRSEKAFGASPTAAQQTTLNDLRETLAQQQKQLTAIEATASAPEPTHDTIAKTTTAPAEDRLQRAKIETAKARAQWKRAEKSYGAAPSNEQLAELSALRTEFERKQAQSAQLESTFATPPTPATEALKQAKIALANTRAELRQATKNQADEATLTRLQAQYDQAEQALHQAEEQCGKPAPEHTLIDKHPIDEATRRLKTELALARAALSKLQHEQTIDADALENARLRVITAEQALTANTPE